MAALAAVLVFSAIVLAITWFGYARYVKPSRMIDQLSVERRSAIELEPKPGYAALGGINTLLASIGKLFPSSEMDQRILRRDLESAGFRSERAVLVYTATRILAALAFLVAAFIGRDLIHAQGLFRIVVLIGATLAGYWLPGMVLDRLIARRRQAIRYGLPDALDLLVICTEAGCALDQAIVTVTRELEHTHPELCDELGIMTLEVLAGRTRQDALRNMADRTGEDEVRRWVALLVQTDRFGTSVANALRTQSESMRVQRRQQAEERAGKIGVKLVFPIFFFCLPSIFIIAAGPGMLQLFRTLPALRSGH